MKTYSKFVLALAFTVASASAWSQETDHAAHHPASPAASQGVGAAVPAAAASSDMSEGVVRKVDKDQKKITIRHGELKNLDMPPMTMVFQVTDPAFVDQVKVGDEVNFVADKLEGKYTVTRIEKKN